MTPREGSFSTLCRRNKTLRPVFRGTCRDLSGTGVGGGGEVRVEWTRPTRGTSTRVSPTPVRGSLTIRPGLSSPRCPRRPTMGVVTGTSTVGPTFRSPCAGGPSASCRGRRGVGTIDPSPHSFCLHPNGGWKGPPPYVRFPRPQDPSTGVLGVVLVTWGEPEIP